MGNASASRSNVSSIPRSETGSFAKYGESLTNRKQSKNVSSKLPPLHVIKDSSMQTDGNASYSVGGFVHIGRLLMLLSFLYFGICYLIICSDYVQSLIVYSHYVKEDLPLTELHRIGLPEARNIEVITEDGVLLRGWHLMHPGEELLTANTLEDTERNNFFDNSLAFSKRVIIYFHGNSHTRGQGFRLRKVKQLAVYLKAHVIAFDYRGFADSEGYPSEAGTHLDARAVVQYVDNIVRRYNPRAVGYTAMAMQASDNSDGGSAEEQSNGDDVITATEGVLIRLFDLLQLREAANAAASTAVASLLGDAADEQLNNNTDVSTIGTNDTKPIVPDASLIQPYTQPKLFIYGHSLGAAISTAIAVEVSNTRPGALSGLILDSPFTSLPEAIRCHPLTTPFRAFPLIFNAMVSNLHYKYPNIDRIEHLSAPLMMMHGDKDIKINATHSHRLFLKATNSPDTTDGTLNSINTAMHFYGVNIKRALPQPPSASVTGFANKASQNITLTCSYTVERHEIRNVGHNEVYSSREWLTLLPSFVSRAELYAVEQNGNC